MKYVSLLAVIAALAVPNMAFAQDVSVSASASVSVSVSVDPSSEISSLSSELSSALSSVSSELSSAVSAPSSESSELSSSASISSSGVEDNCDDLDIATMNVGPIDAAALAVVTSVTVFTVDDCSGLGDLATMDATALAAVSTSQVVIDALAAQGESGGEIIAYTLEDTSLTVYVRSRNQ